MARLVWTAPALADLEGIAEYIALDKPSAANAFVRRVFDRVEALAVHPSLGRIPPEMATSVYRELVVGPCRIFYRQKDDDVLIIYVHRGERLLQQYLLEERG